MPLSPTASKKARNRFFTSREEKMETLMTIAQAYGRTKRPDELASELGIPKNIIQSYATNMRAMGIDIPRLKSAGVYVLLLEEVKRKHPNLLTEEARKRLSK